MANKYIDTTVLDKALIYAVEAHANTERRGKGLPYIVHPIEAVAIVATITTDQELLAAAALHDVVEDTDRSEEDIRSEFGDRVASLVCSETDNLEGAPWKVRKQANIDRLKAAGYDSKIVAMGDKLSNIRAIAADYYAIGDKLWSRFHCDDPSQIGWYYRSMGEAMSELSETVAYKEYMSLVDKVFGTK